MAPKYTQNFCFKCLNLVHLIVLNLNGFLRVFLLTDSLTCHNKNREISCHLQPWKSTITLQPTRRKLYKTREGRSFFPHAQRQNLRCCIFCWAWKSQWRWCESPSGDWKRSACDDVMSAVSNFIDSARGKGSECNVCMVYIYLSHRFLYIHAGEVN